MLLALLAVPAFAETTGRGQYTTPCPYVTDFLNNNEYISHNHQLPDEARLTTGVKLDAPNLIRFTRNLTLGAEVGKDIYTDPFMDGGSWVEDDKGYTAYVKITYTGTLWDLRR